MRIYGPLLLSMLVAAAAFPAFLPLEARASPDISYTALFLEDRTGLASGNGTSIQIEAGINDPLGVPGNILSVRAQHTITGQTYFLPFRGLGNFTTPSFAPYYLNPQYDFIPQASRTGKYQITVTNDQFQTDTAITQELKLTTPLTRAMNIKVTGPDLTPLIAWTRPPGSDRYELRINDANTGALIYDTPTQASTLFQIPSGILSSSHNYNIDLFSIDRDANLNFERRSLTRRAYTTHAAPPLPASTPPTKEDAALFARAAYGNGGSVPSGFFEITDLRRQGAGFESRMYSNSTKTQVVFAIAGTDDAQDVIADASFVTGVPNSAFRSQVDMAAKVLRELKTNSTYASFASAAITATGHSLGGAIAQIIGQTAGLRTLSFNAPGPGHLVDAPELATSLNLIRSQNPGTDIANYRVFGDLVSTVGQQLGQTFTHEPPIPTFFISADPLATFKSMHFIDTVISQLGEKTTSAIGPTVNSVAVDTILLGIANPTALVLSVLVNGGINYVIDPGGVDGYVFNVEDGSPLVNTLTFPFLLASEALFQLETLVDEHWILLGTFNELDTYNFGPLGVNGFRFFLLDYDTGLPLTGVEEFSFGVTFATSGLVKGELRSFSTVPEPSTLVVFLTVLSAGIIIRRRSRQA